MVKPITLGIPARQKYKPIRYSHITIKPGQDSLLSADPWSYLHGHLLRCISKSRSTKKISYERASYYANLAEEFYKAGLLTNLPAQGTLIYYGMLNLVKCLLSTRGIPLETQIEHHGITLTPSMKFELQIQSSSKDHVNIFAEFAKILGTPITGKTTVKLQDAVSHIPELHAISHNLGFVRRPKFLPINIEFLTTADHLKIFTELSFSKAAEQTHSTKKFLQGRRAKYFVEGAPQDGQKVYRSKLKKSFSQNSATSYKNILKEYQSFNIASILTRSGYRYYCDLEPGNYHHLCFTYLVMFYIGTAARYRPSEVNEALNGTLRPLVTEAMALCPQQFMYQIISLITEQLCVIPFSKI